MKSVLITGASRGLGKGFVDYFLKQDFMVFAGARGNESGFDQGRSNKNLIIIPLDITNDESISKAVDIISKRTESLDYLINNAGVNKDTATNWQKEIVCNLEDLDRKTLVRMFDINAISPMMVLQKCLPLLKKDPSFVVNISSNRASFEDENEIGNYGYRASKVALNMMTLCSLFDLPQNVKTFAVHPGDVKTDMNPEGYQDPERQAEAIIKITNNWDEGFNGKFLKYDGTVYRI